VNRAQSIAWRVRADYLQRERLDELRALLQSALDRGYRPMTLSAFAARVASPPLRADDPILLLRHDVDTDVPRARRMWDLEQRLGVVGSWFFRRRTWEVDFMQELSAAGCEVGYHYEELATVAKERGAASAAQARALLGVARARLRTTLSELRASSGLALDVLAAHGDFANRALGVSNVELLADPGFRAQIGVRLEAYDIEPQLSARSSDGVPPTGWWPEDPSEAIARGERTVGVLLHPRSWGGAPAANAHADLVRLREGCAYRLRRALPKA
jgi:hypothetical protein